MKYFLIIFLIAPLIACNLQAKDAITSEDGISPNYSSKDSNKICQFYEANKGDNEVSKSIGTVSKGRLTNGKLIPYFGDNFTYFDTSSYFGNRAFTNEKVKEIILKSYAELKKIVPERHFYLMELSNKKGGKMFPHKTQQNGLSADFMMPKLKDGKPYYGLDTLGVNHYWLHFDDSGSYAEDKTIKIDFDLIAQHILVLEKQAQKEGFKVAKVIIKIEYKDELFATPNGKKLQKSGVYIVQGLSKVVNNLHDDHFHIDFEKI